MAEETVGITVNTDTSDTPPAESHPVVRLDQLRKVYGSGAAQRVVIEELSLEVHAGEFVSIVGPSGIGKTTLLRCVTGLTRTSGGTVVIDGAEVTSPPPGVAVVFQDYSRSLMPWTSILRNVSMPLRVHGVARKTAEQRAEEALDSVGLAGRGRQYPWEVSGGMQQRVAIARGLAYEPKILVMDEPFASVDAQTRLELEELVHSLHRDRNMTMLFVTHDIDEAVFLSDRVIVLGGPPATVVDEVHINLEKPRNQITTRSDPDFGIARTRILQSIYKTRQAPRA